MFVLIAVPLDVVTLIHPEVALVGTIAVICESESTVNEVMMPLNATREAPVKLVPVMITLLPGAPLVGEKLKSVGGRLVWPSTLLRSTTATSLGKAVKNV